MENKLRTDIVFDEKTMTREQAAAYDSFIDYLVELYRKYGPDFNKNDEIPEAVEQA